MQSLCRLAQPEMMSKLVPSQPEQQVSMGLASEPGMLCSAASSLCMASSLAVMRQTARVSRRLQGEARRPCEFKAVAQTQGCSL